MRPHHFSHFSYAVLQKPNQTIVAIVNNTSCDLRSAQPVYDDADIKWWMHECVSVWVCSRVALSLTTAYGLLMIRFAQFVMCN